jgi:hypothetical protein
MYVRSYRERTVALFTGSTDTDIFLPGLAGSTQYTAAAERERSTICSCVRTGTTTERAHTRNTVSDSE